jgi:hypothetical protein
MLLNFHDAQAGPVRLLMDADQRAPLSKEQVREIAQWSRHHRGRPVELKTADVLLVAQLAAEWEQRGEALAFYANEKRYDEDGRVWFHPGVGRGDEQLDRGNVARAALGVAPTTP